MKYNILNQTIPQNSRRELNDKILYLIDNDLAESSGITKEDIYNAYTGDGGLHGLKYSDFDSYYEYSNAKKEIENGQFFTPPLLCQFIMDCLNPSGTDVVADLTCGMGGFFNFAPAESNVYGCELDIKAYKVAKYLYPKANLTYGDIRSYSPGIKFDYVVGNPPFNIYWWVDENQIISQLYYCQKAAELMKPMGIMALVVPASFLADDFSDGSLIKEMEKHFSFLGQFMLDKDMFSNIGVYGYETKVQFWQRNSETDGWISHPYSTEMTIDAVSLNSVGVDTVKHVCLDEAQALFRKNRSHILLELSQQRDMSSNFMYQVKKYLYAIKSHPILKEKYVKCCEYLNKFFTQKQPEDMSYEEWCRVRLTEAKVLAYLRGVVSKQHPKKYEDVIRMVNFGYSIGYKAYSPKMARRMPEYMKNATPIYQIVSDGMDAEQYGNFSKLIRRKQREYQIEQIPLSSMVMDESIGKYLDEFTLYDSENDEEIRLNDIQKHDINLVLQKRNMLLQWEQGSGKTLAGIATGLYRMERQNAFCTWVVSSAISIKNNWDVVLPNYGLPYVMVNRMKDLEQIKCGNFVIITLNMLSKYQRQIKSWIKAHGGKIALCFDESDEMTNPSSLRAKAVLNIFRRCRFKLLMTGTSTRNNIAEFFPQLELAYNNSANMISWCRTIYRYDRSNKKEGVEEGLHEYPNSYYGKPIPPYRKGFRLFSESHLPEKITVFGVAQRNQDIFNADELSDILGRFVITRTFEEVSGKDIKRIHQVPVRFTDSERFVYRKAIAEFEKMRSNYFSSTGNLRKDAMMRLIQQITLLLRISAAPNTVHEYTGGAPTKILKVLNMLDDMHDEIVAIGVRHKIVVNAYAEAIRERFPDRPLFVVTGSTTTLAARRKLRKTLRESNNGILLCTQQSLPSSVNFEFVDNVIIPELHYNNSRMSQFYMRFIRYNSTREKNIYFVTYLGSIESNQMQMVLAKEKLNLFMRGQDTDLDDIYERFGVDYDLLSVLMSREMDENGKMYIKWGEQNIV